MQIRTLRRIARFLYRTFARLDIAGLEKVPLEGGLLIATNHLSRLDPPLVFATVERNDMTALVADKYKKFPGINWLIKQVKGIWLNREEADVRAMREARDYLRAGGVLGIAPEGTRSPSHALLPAKTGAAYLADKAGVPIVPAAVWGTENAFSKLFKLRRPTIHLRFGDPFHLPAVERRTRDADLLRNTDEIMCRLAALLPPEYRGAYADHPRLKELLAEKVGVQVSERPQVI
jgi:1-acyl-sn-glycerol-3-phosphate acyltransferase